MSKTTQQKWMNPDWVIRKIELFKASPAYQDARIAQEYCAGKQEIDNKVRVYQNTDGEMVELKNLPNNKVMDNQYQRFVSQKVNYFLGRAFTVVGKTTEQTSALTALFGSDFHRKLLRVGEESINCGRGWMYLGISETGELKFWRFPFHEIVPIWKDREHEELECAIRFWDELIDEDSTRHEYARIIEVYAPDQIIRYRYEKGKCVQTEKQSYFQLGKKTGNWPRIPLIPFRFNHQEIPLIRRIKSLQDVLNLIESVFLDVVAEDPRSTVLVVVNYDGEDVERLRRNYAQTGIIKVSTVDGVAGDVRQLSIQVNAQNYDTIVRILKRQILENARGFDCKDDRLGSNPNRMNLKMMYAEADLDANEMEVEYQASMEQIVSLINYYRTLRKQPALEDVVFTFNRDTIVSESEVIADCVASLGLLSRRTCIEQHPWTIDVDEELERLADEEAEEPEFDAEAETETQ